MAFGGQKRSGPARGGGNADARRPAEPQGNAAKRQCQAASKPSKPAKAKQGNQRLELCRLCEKTSKDVLISVGHIERHSSYFAVVC